MATKESTFFPLFSQLHPQTQSDTREGIRKKHPTSNDLLVRERVRRQRVEVLLNSKRAAERLVRALPTVVQRRQLSIDAITDLIAEAFCVQNGATRRVS